AGKNRLLQRFVMVLVLILLQAGYAFAVTLSDSSRISLLTCAPGAELYSAFGHNGIRVTDYKQGWDVVFNYGTFDDSQPGFYVNFVKGQMIYSITYDAYQDFLEEYIEEKRSVTEQELRLTPEERQQVFATLYVNALPQNRNYPYDFFWDNCATRPRDVFEKILGTKLQYHNDTCGFEKGKTMHDMLRLYVHNRPWVDFGFDLILGLPCEVPATPRSQTFLPDYMARMFSCATVNGLPFVTQTKTLLDFPPPKIDTGITPLNVTLAIMIIGLLLVFVERRIKRHIYLFDFVYFFITGALGLLFLSLWLFTTHYSVPKNMNMLWLLPSHFIIAFLLLKKQKPVWLRYYFLATYFLMIILLATWKWNPQPLNYAFAPLIVLLATRSLTIFQDIKSKLNQ
ncbi:MAG TPA: DUF4105 domain-containing protein, partial [Chitinophagales bacterium]|nr:DUF4105 domain-containing protein [Chitinophagales bacterium]